MSADPILVTGAAGFIGFHVARRLAAGGRSVMGFDNLNAYYDQARLDALAKESNFCFVNLDVANRAGMAALFTKHRLGHPASGRAIGFVSSFCDRPGEAWPIKPEPCSGFGGLVCASGESPWVGRSGASRSSSPAIPTRVNRV